MLPSVFDNMIQLKVLEQQELNFRLDHRNQILRNRQYNRLEYQKQQKEYRGEELIISFLQLIYLLIYNKYNVLDYTRLTFVLTSKIFFLIFMMLNLSENEVYNRKWRLETASNLKGSSVEKGLTDNSRAPSCHLPSTSSKYY